MKKNTWLTTDDVEAHFVDLCWLPGIGDPFAATRRLIRTFSDDPSNLATCFNHLTRMQLDMEGPADA